MCSAVSFLFSFEVLELEIIGSSFLLFNLAVLQPAITDVIYRIVITCLIS